MNPPEILPEEAVNREPLSRFKYREAKIVYCEPQMKYDWIVKCGHKSLREHVGIGETLEEALYDAGIDSHE